MSKGKCLNLVEHVLLRPENYIGSIHTQKDLIWTWTDIVQKQKIDYNPGLVHIFKEVLDNAVDNKTRDDQENTMTKITIEIKDDTISILNDGKCIPIEKTNFEFTDYTTNQKTEKELYPSELFFGYMQSGTNFNDDDRKTAGLHGLGVKCTNIFSTYFKVDQTDGKLRFVQEYKNNLSFKTVPKISPSVKKYTKIIFRPDLKRFGVESLNTDFTCVAKKLALDAALISGCCVVFNNEKIKVPTLKNYIGFFGKSVFCFPIKQDNFQCCITFCESVKTEGLQHVSFVNGICTKNGGIFTKLLTKKVLSPIVDLLNKKVKCTLKDLYQYILVFCVVKISNSTFIGQTKSELAYTKQTVEKIKNQMVVDENQLKQILKWEIVDKLKNQFNQKEIKKEKQIEGKKERLLLGDKLVDANWASSLKSKQTVLFIVEGLSAMKFVSDGRSSIPNGQDMIGIYSIRGKFKNVYNSTISDTNSNKEVKELKQVLGLKTGLDYSTEKNLSTLRYGKVCILTDADKDGYHICGLLLNYFFCKFKSLWDSQFFESLSTPILKVHFKDSTSMSFFSLKEFEQWKMKTQKKNYTVRYYKGLGTSKPKDAIEAFKNKKKVNYYLTEKSEDFVKLAFDSKSTNNRKEWLTVKNTQLDRYEGNMSFDEFIDGSLKSFHLENIKRSLPNMFDGLKESQRKILFGSFLKKITESIKVTQLQGFITEKTEYKYGDTSLVETIVKMAQNFVGSNNIPYFIRDGNFGSRMNGGEDAAHGRYIYTKLESIIYTIFPQIDFEFLDRVEEDGVLLEPVFYIPIIPMLLVNGCTGIATGFSTYIPNFSPLDLVQWIRNWLNKTSPNCVPTPWFSNFKGNITPIDEQGVSFQTSGIYKHIKDKKYRIIELPIGVWTNKYKEYLEDLLKDGKIIDYKDLNSPENVNFIVETDDTDILKLNCTISMKNAVYLDHQGLPKKIISLNDFLQEFCEKRFNLYTKRKEKISRDIEYNLNISISKKQFIQSVINNDIDLNDTEESILQFLTNNEYFKVNNSFSFLLDLSIRQFTKDNLNQLETKIVELKQQLESIKSLTEKKLWNIDLDSFVSEYNEYLKLENIL